MASRHQAALSFLYNISLDGSRNDFNTQTIDENKKLGDNACTDSPQIDHQLISNVTTERFNDQPTDESQVKQIVDRNKFRDKQRLRLSHVQPVALSTNKCLPYAIFSVIPYSKENILYVYLRFAGCQSTFAKFINYR